MEQKSFNEKNAWFLKILWLCFFFVLTAFGSYWVNKQLPKLHPWAIESFVWWLVTLVALTRVKPENKEGFWKKSAAYAERVLLSLFNLALLSFATITELIYLGKSSWFALVPAVLWIVILTLIVFSNHRRDHPKEESESFEEEQSMPSGLENLSVKHELLAEFGLPVRSGAYLNLADFQNALADLAHAKITTAKAEFLQSIVAAQNKNAISAEEAAQQIRNELGIRDTNNETPIEETQRLVVPIQSTTRSRKGWRP
ncbi:MAG: hypothetical protein WAV51_00720 [Microgenomates group bacterium]